MSRPRYEDIDDGMDEAEGHYPGLSTRTRRRRKPPQPRYFRHSFRRVAPTIPKEMHVTSPPDTSGWRLDDYTSFAISARRYHKRGIDPHIAYEVLKHGIQIYPKNATLHRELGRISLSLATDKKTQHANSVEARRLLVESGEHFEEAKRLDPYVTCNYDPYIYYLTRVGELQKAEQLYALKYSSRPDRLNAENYEHISNFYLRLSKNAADESEEQIYFACARSCLNRALGIPSISANRRKKLLDDMGFAAQTSHAVYSPADDKIFEERMRTVIKGLGAAPAASTPAPHPNS